MKNRIVKKVPKYALIKEDNVWKMDVFLHNATLRFGMSAEEPVIVGQPLIVLEFESKEQDAQP